MVPAVLDGGWFPALVAANALAASASAAVLRAARRRPAERHADGLVLQFDAAGRRRVAWFAAACGLQAVGWALLASDRSLPWGAQVVLGMASLVFAVAAARVWSGQGIAVRADAVGITVVRGDGSARTLPFAAIRAVRLSPLLGGCELRGDAGQRLRFPGHLPGMREFLRWLRQHVPASRWRRFGSAVQGYQEASRAAEQGWRLP